MASKLQRGRGDLGQDRYAPVESLYSRICVGLDDDHRIVFPEMYIEHPDLYDQIVGIAYLVRGVNPEDRLDWIWEGAVEKLRSRYPDVQILAKQLIVRLRLPWNKVDTEWTCSREELDGVREDVDILDVFVFVEDKQDPGKRKLVEPIEFEENRDRYNVLEIRYSVRWKMSKEQEEKLLEIDPRYM